MQTIAQFKINYYQFLNEKNKLASDAPPFAHDIETLVRLYRLMVLNRVFDAKAIALQRTGKMGTYPSIRGQEAVFVGVGDALEKEDIFVPYYRDVPTLMQRGVKLSNILSYWGGDERGNSFASTSNFPYSVPIATQTLHAAGLATAVKIRKEKKAVLVMCGDGATSEGDFYEAMNVAGVWKLPIVFVINNNQWAISVARSQQTATETLAQKAIAAGFPGEQVDGNDVIAVRSRVYDALQRAREEQQPTLLELVCYRQSDHTTADDASRYESKDVREQEWKKEPILRLKQYLESQNAWSPENEEKLLTSCTTEVEEIVQEYAALGAPTLESMFDYLYEKLPACYSEQREMLKMQGLNNG